MVFSFHRKGLSGVGCYGKLPLHGDYVSHASDGAEARRLTAWLDAGYRLTGGTDDRDAAETRFVLPAGKRALFGALWPSADASGTRRFPFALFAEVPGKDLAQLGSGIPLALAPAWFRMTSAFPSLREAGSPDAIPPLLDGIGIPGLPLPEEVRGELLRDAGEPGDASGAADVLFDLHRLAGMLSGGRKGAVPAFAVMIPLRTGYGPELEAAAWLEVLVRRLGSADLPGGSHLFLRPGRDGAEGALFVVHRELREADLGFILSPTEEYPYGNVLGLPGDDPEAAGFRERLSEEAGPSPTLKDLVELEPAGSED